MTRTCPPPRNRRPKRRRRKQRRRQKEEKRGEEEDPRNPIVRRRPSPSQNHPAPSAEEGVLPRPPRPVVCMYSPHLSFPLPPLPFCFAFFHHFFRISSCLESVRGGTLNRKPVVRMYSSYLSPPILPSSFLFLLVSFYSTSNKPEASGGVAPSLLFFSSSLLCLFRILSPLV